MPLENTEAIVLKSFNWSESSRTVVFFSRDFGKIALVDRGGRSFKSRRGRLIPFARMDITFYGSQKEASGYISDVGLIEAFSFEREGTLGRLAYGSAACELSFLLLPEQEPQQALYAYFAGFLKAVDTVHKRSLPGLFLAFFLRLLSQLGYHPSLAYCGSCGKATLDRETGLASGAGTGPVPFFPDRGGFVCKTCQTAADHYIPLSQEGFGYLLVLQNASLNEAAALPIRYSDAVQLLDALMRFVSYQTGLKADLKSLEFLAKLKNTGLTE